MKSVTSRALILGQFAVVVASAQPYLHLKTRNLEPVADRPPAVQAAPQRRMPGQWHLLIQFQAAPTAGQLQELQRRGVTILQYVPDYGLSIAVRDDTELEGIGLRWSGAWSASDKLSPLLGPAGLASPRAPQNESRRTQRYCLVEFHPDVPVDEARALVLNEQLTLLDNPDLAPNHLLVRGNLADVARLAGWDEVAYIFPASEDLVEGRPVIACAGALTQQGTAGQSIPKVGDGWDGPGLNAATVSYAFGTMTYQLPVDAAKAEIQHALAEWVKYVKVNFTPTTGGGLRTINILFARDDHGDGYPFPPGSNILAHTFYPAPPNPEPIAGDLHFNDDRTWHIGSDTDLFSVALHELGHALGLGHSDQPTAVMYPYYKRVSGLSGEDIGAIQSMYAAQDGTGGGTPPTSPAPFTLQITSPASSGSYKTASQRISVSGMAAQASGIAKVTWSNSRGGSGQATGTTAWSTGTIALVSGLNILTIQAVAKDGGTASASLQVTYTPAAPDYTAPTLMIVAPAATSISTSASSIALSGTARDNVGVTQVTWLMSSGSAGVATGTSNWTIGSVPLLIGANTITVRAWDAAGNMAWRSVVVTRR